MTKVVRSLPNDGLKMIMMIDDSLEAYAFAEYDFAWNMIGRRGGVRRMSAWILRLCCILLDQWNDRYL